MFTTVWIITCAWQHQHVLLHYTQQFNTASVCSHNICVFRRLDWSLVWFSQFCLQDCVQPPDYVFDGGIREEWRQRQDFSKAKPYCAVSHRQLTAAMFWAQKYSMHHGLRRQKYGFHTKDSGNDCNTFQKWNINSEFSDPKFIHVAVFTL